MSEDVVMVVESSEDEPISKGVARSRKKQRRADPDPDVVIVEVAGGGEASVAKPALESEEGGEEQEDLIITAQSGMFSAVHAKPSTQSPNLEPQTQNPKPKPQTLHQDLPHARAHCASFPIILTTARIGQVGAPISEVLKFIINQELSVLIART